MVREIKLTQGKVTLVDDSAFEQLNQHKWCCQLKRRTGYATRSQNGTTQYMHRLIMNAPKGLEVDHINGDGLDNRRCNLRICTQAENLANTPRARARKAEGIVADANIGTKVAVVRRMLCLTQRKLRGLCGLSLSAQDLSNIESGYRQPTEVQLADIKTALRWSPKIDAALDELEAAINGE